MSAQLSGVRGVITLGVVALVCISCGGGDRLSKAEFAKEATAVCRRVSRHSHATIPPFSHHRDASHALERIVAADRDDLRDLRDLKPEKTLAGPITSWLAVIDQMLDEADLVVEGLRDGDGDSVRGAAARADLLAQRALVLAHKIGVEGCKLPALGTSH